MSLIKLFRSEQPLTVDLSPTRALTPGPDKKPNFLMQGSRLIGNVTVSSDLEISGEVQGNITAKESASVCVKGICKGSIETHQGDISLEGKLSNGNIKSGGNVSITGCFQGESVQAEGRAYINGEFKGTLHANEVEIGPLAKIKGEIHYKDSFSVEKGAAISCQLIHLNESELEEEKTQEVEVVFEKVG